MMVSTVRGRLGPVRGRLELDPEHPEKADFEIAVDVAGIYTGDERRDGHLRSDDFFAAESHPEIVFKSNAIFPKGEGRYTASGDLTIRGTTKEVVLDVEGPSPFVKSQRGVVTGATATTRIKRLEYGLKYNAMVEAGPVVGDEVSITIDIEANRPAIPGSTQ
jgi:polyisoprenoid-binding protein YceI